jgi:phosphopantetheinyl transferase
VLPGEWAAGALEIAKEPGGRPFVRLAPEARPVGRVAPGARLPIGVSISHTEGHVFCAATASGEDAHGPRRALGVDLGAVEPRSDAFLDTFFTDEEQWLVRDCEPPYRARCANLVWCAKEAVLKALGLGLDADTRWVSCLPAPGEVAPDAWPLAPGGHGWWPFVASCAPALVPGGTTIRGIWRSFPGFVGALALLCGAIRTAERRASAVRRG